MTKLEAVNELLLRLGHRQVAALNTGGASTAGNAERIIDQQHKIIERQGWYWNTFIDVELTPDGSDNLVVPAGVYTIDTYGQSAHLNLRSNGTNLYNVTDNTDEFDDPVRVAYTQTVAFTAIPPAFQGWIVAEAAKSLFLLTNGSDPKERQRLREIEMDIRQARAMAMRDEAEVADVNVLLTDEAKKLKGMRNRYSQYIAGE